MLMLSAGAKRMIGDAVQRFPDTHMRAVWDKWSEHIPTSARDQDDGGSIATAIPRPVIKVALAALDVKSDQLLKERDEVVDNERFYYENDLSFISSKKVSLIAMAD